MDTKSLRKHIRQKRRSLSDSEREHASFLACERITSSRAYQRSKHIAFYLSHDAEIDLSLLIQHAWQQGKHVYLPVLAKPNTNKLWFIPYTPKSKLRNNCFAIPEPIHSHKTRLRKTQSLDLILMPLVAFDLQGHRVGMGGGFYDRTFSFLNHRQHWHKPSLIGVAYELQKQESLETNSWDIPLQAIATEKHLYLTNKK